MGGAEAADTHLVDIAWVSLELDPLGNASVFLVRRTSAVVKEVGPTFFLPTPVPGTSQVWLTQRRQVSPCCS